MVERKTIIRVYLKKKAISLEKIVSFPFMILSRIWLFYKVQYVNTGKRDIEVIKWVNHGYTSLDNGDTPAFWSFQGSSHRRTQRLDASGGFLIFHRRIIWE